jgi:galactose-1-phosphate uridylyltransferase
VLISWSDRKRGILFSLNEQQAVTIYSPYYVREYELILSRKFMSWSLSVQHFELLLQICLYNIWNS